MAILVAGAFFVSAAVADDSAAGRNDGDLNGDGVFDLADATHLLRQLLDGGVPADSTRADVNRDGVVDFADVYFIMQAVQPTTEFVAPSPQPTGHFEQQLRAADFVFQGVVTSIDYASSEPVGDSPALPHTFVTFSIERVFKGQRPLASDREITLRFLGGAAPDGRVLRTSLTPYFTKGQREILLVKNNGEYTTPLSYGPGRRFRLIDGEVYSEDGREVVIDSVGRLGFGEWHELDVVRTIRIGGQVFERHYSRPVDENGRGIAQSPTDGVTTEAFVEYLARLVETAHDPAELASASPVESMDPALPFVYQLSTAKGAVAGLDTPQPASLPDDPAEREAVLERGGDPVLPTTKNKR